MKSHPTQIKRRRWFCLTRSPEAAVKNMSVQTRASGFSLLLLTLLIGSISVIFSLTLATMTRNSTASNLSAKYRLELSTIRQTIATRLSCPQTLGLAPDGPDTAPPNTTFSCGDPQFSNITLRNAGGESIVPANGKIGNWTIGASCQQDQIVVTATWPGNNPLTGISLNAIPTNGQGATVSTDLFGGWAHFCRSYFRPDYSPCAENEYTNPPANYPNASLPYPYYFGPAGISRHTTRHGIRPPIQRCCRAVNEFYAPVDGGVWLWSPCNYGTEYPLFAAKLTCDAGRGLDQFMPISNFGYGNECYKLNVDGSNSAVAWNIEGHEHVAALCCLTNSDPYPDAPLVNPP